MPRALAASVVALLVLGRAAAGAGAPADDGLDARIHAASLAAYALDTDVAIRSMREAAALWPDESRAHRALAGFLWLDILFQRGAVTIEAYLAGLTSGALSLPAPPPDLAAEFKHEVERAIDLAGQRLDADSHDNQARYDLGSAYGLQASYRASVEGSTTSAFLAARRAFDAQEQVLHNAPQLIGAGLVVGTYRYLVSSMGLPARMFAYAAGFGGGKAEGIRLLEAAADNADTHVEAKTALALIASREGRHADAMQLLAGLADEFPRNRIFLLEEGSAAIRAKRFAEADALLSRGLEALDHEGRRHLRGERATWLYKRGQGRVLAGREADAAADLHAALSNSPVEWIRGRITIELGKIADLDGDRPAAIAAYRSARAIARAVDDPAAAAQAARLEKQPWGRPRVLQ
jgi:tetratricopeptide (TPR) repeat protein